jgi:hypothetical protein
MVVGRRKLEAHGGQITVGHRDCLGTAIILPLPCS